MEFEVFIPDNDCVRLISQFVEEMDLTALYGTYERMPSEKYASPVYFAPDEPLARNN